jgi:hypothetical protein
MLDESDDKNTSRNSESIWTQKWFTNFDLTQYLHGLEVLENDTFDIEQETLHR